MQPNQNSQLPDINTIPGPKPLSNGPVFKDTPRKKSHAMLYGMILLAILAAGGIGFGTWAMLDGNQKVEKLNAKINDLNNQLSEQNPATGEGDITNGNGENVATPDYIYVGEWGIKIAKPENWRDSIAGYSFSNAYPQAVDTLTISQISDSNDANIIISNIGETTCDTQVLEANAACVEINGENYVITPSATVSTEVAEFFTNIDSYSPIYGINVVGEPLFDTGLEDSDVEEEVEITQ